MMHVSKQKLLTMAHRGQLRRGAMQMTMAPASRNNPRRVLETLGGTELGWLPYHERYRSKIDKAILAAVDKRD